MGITQALVDFAFDLDTGEGRHAALYKVEKWRNAIEEMVEVSNEKELRACSVLLEAIKQATCRLFSTEET